MTDPLSQQRVLELIRIVQNDPHKWVEAIVSGDESVFDGFSDDERTTILSLQLRRLDEPNRRKVEMDLARFTGV